MLIQILALFVLQAVHTGDKPFKCVECDKTFRTQLELQSHMGRHTGVKPFKCDICEKEFISTITFKRHAIVHSGMICSFAFKFIWVLRCEYPVHRRCPFFFQQLDSLSFPARATRKPREKKEGTIFSFRHLTLLRLRWINLPRFLFSYSHLTFSKEKTEDLWRGMPHINFSIVNVDFWLLVTVLEKKKKTTIKGRRKLK